LDGYRCKVMTANDLTIPLRRARNAAMGARRKLPASKLLAGLCLGLLAGIAGFVSFTTDPLGGEPIATASIQRMPRPVAAAPETAKPPADTANVRHLPANDPSQQRQAATDIESEAGVKVTRQNGQAPGSVVIRVPDAQPTIRLAAAPDRRLIEKGRHGSLPKIGPEGIRPADVYARPVTAQQRTAPVRIAIVIGGLGISTNTTQDAIQRLPPSISLAFAPYGADLERQVARAREDGHEVLLQAPMEPFDYPDNDPGPHTLVASLPSDQNMDRLQWLLARFPGYVGVINFMGGRFTANDAALAPVMKEIAGRGLLYMDDGSSGRSLAPQMAASAGVSATRADVVIDAVQRGPEIDAALARLEKIAREKGTAVGYGAALPVTIERLNRWAKTAESRGITLVPVSALVSSPRRS
jgi:polysaccharide deacetylase 2 family uncharacterized protein YibQ